MTAKSKERNNMPHALTSSTTPKPEVLGSNKVCVRARYKAVHAIKCQKDQ